MTTSALAGQPGRTVPPLVITSMTPTVDVYVSDQATPHQPVAEPPERFLDRVRVKERVTGAHPTSGSWAATCTPRRRNAAGACTTASTRAAALLNGNQNRLKERSAAQGGQLARPGRTGARPGLPGTHPSVHRQCRRAPPPAALAGPRPVPHRYSSRNSAVSHHRRDSSAPVSKSARAARVSGRCAATIIHTHDASTPKPGPGAGHAATAATSPRKRASDLVPMGWPGQAAGRGHAVWRDPNELVLAGLVIRDAPSSPQPPTSQPRDGDDPGNARRVPPAHCEPLAGPARSTSGRQRLGGLAWVAWPRS